MLALVCKLLRDVRWPLLIVALLLFGFSLLWVKVAQRVTTEIAPPIVLRPNKVPCGPLRISIRLTSGRSRLAPTLRAR